MNAKTVKTVYELAKEVSDMASDLLLKSKEYEKACMLNPHSWISDPLCGSKESAALRRRSMDLTRALAELRKSQ